MTLLPGLERGRAEISPCGRYRTWLERTNLLHDANEKTVTFIMLNPSTADAEKDDPTIRRCMGYARTWGYTTLVIVNAYAWRDTLPKRMFAAAARGEDIVGPGNDLAIEKAVRLSSLVIVAWGKNIAPTRQRDVGLLIRIAGGRARCLGTNTDGTPVHPLYQPKDAVIEPWGGGW